MIEYNNVIKRKNSSMRYLILVMIACFTNTLSGQHNIKFKINNYENDTLIVGYYLGDKQLVHDTLMAQKPGKFVMKGDSTLNKGFYLLLTIPDNKIVQFLIDEDQEFEMETDVNRLEISKFKGSLDNELFSDYVAFLSKQRPKADALRQHIDALEMGDPKRDELMKQLDDFDSQVEAEQNIIKEKHPNTLTAMLINSNTGIDFPEFEGDEKEQKMQTWQYYKQHYFDHIDLGNPSSLRTPFLDTRVKYYMKNLTANHPDSLIRSIDYLLKEMRPAEETFRFYLSTFLNEYIQSKIVGMDAVYVHLAENYYAKGDAPWLDEETTNTIVDNAMDIKPVLIGETAQDIQVYLEDGSPIKISDIDYEYLVVMFWAPDCGHCKKSMPDVVEFYEEYKDKGVKLLAICTKHKEKTKSCWEILEEKEMTGFINAADTNHRSLFKLKYNVKTTPKIFVLDPDRKILMKNIGGAQLKDVMEELFRRAKEEQGMD